MIRSTRVACGVSSKRGMAQGSERRASILASSGKVNAATVPGRSSVPIP